MLVRGAASFQVVGTIASFSAGSVGEGEFTNEEDRQKLAPVMQSIVRNKLVLSLRAGDLPAYRRQWNLQVVHLRGLDAETVCNLPGDEASPSEDSNPVTSFLYQNGLVNVHHRDSAGFRPLHYAALSGNHEVVQGLLARRADPNRWTTKPEPTLGFPPWASALGLASYYGHSSAAKLLISARAQLGGLIPSMCMAARSDAESLRVLRAGGGDPMVQNAFGFSCLDTAAGYGNLAAMEELMSQAQHGPEELGRALQAAMNTCGGSAEVVELLIGRRADVDFQYDLRRDLSRLGRLIFARHSFKHWVGRRSAASAQAYHCHGRTPLMAAIMSGQHEGAAALIAAGARLDLRNCRNWTAADFAKGQELPLFLRQGLQGDPTGCLRVASLAHPDEYVEVRF